VAWVVAAVAPDQLTAEMWVELLRNAGVPALIQPSDAVSFLGTSPLSCRVQVPEERLVEARMVLTRELGGEEEAPA
jgi:hypothetical protein